MELIRIIEDIIALKGSDAPSPKELHAAVAGGVMSYISERWAGQEAEKSQRKRAAYLSAEFLVGRAVYNNLLSLGLTEKVKTLFEMHGFDFYSMEELPDPALGNGGLGRLAACYLDSAATKGIALDGYGLRYRYGLFRQSFEDGFQHEEADDWGAETDPWSVRREEEAVEVAMGEMRVKAVPYDMPVVGYAPDGKGDIGRLRLWQAEALGDFDFGIYRKESVAKAFSPVLEAMEINALLYPDDSKRRGRVLRLRQQYFFSYASIRDMLRVFGRAHGTDFAKFPDYYAIQLNDTHPVSAIPCLIGILMDEHGYSFDEAFGIAARTFSYTNHTVMPEALEQWDTALLRSVLPEIYEVIRLIDGRLRGELAADGISREASREYNVVSGGRVHMARLASYVCGRVNGVSEIHTKILREDVLRRWHERYPERFVNVTNGVTQRRWLALCNPELSVLITDILGGNGWMTDLEELGELRKYADDASALERFAGIKARNKERLTAYLSARKGISVDPAMVFGVQIKRVHEYKRQLLAALGIIDLYFSIKENDREISGIPPAMFLFGGKAAPSYVRAKAVIKLINEIARMIDADPVVSRRLKVCFVPDYNVSSAEMIIPAAEFSEQISTAGTEASGTGNMKLSLNGAVTIGTYDGANIEIFRAAGLENNYVFGARVEELAEMREGYDPAGIYKNDGRLKRAVDCLINGMLGDGGDGSFKELYDSLLKGASWHAPDHYFLLRDFAPYREARITALRDYNAAAAFARKGFMNTAGCGGFSSDRSVMEYAEKIWGLKGNSR